MRQLFTLLLQHTDVALQLLFTQACHVTHVRLGHFPLKLQQVHQPMGVVGQRDPLHQRRLARPLGRIRLPVRMQHTGQMPEDGLHRVAGLLLCHFLGLASLLGSRRTATCISPCGLVSRIRGGPTIRNTSCRGRETMGPLRGHGFDV